MIRFKDDRIRDEWQDYTNISERLRSIIYLIEQFIDLESPGYDGLTLTCLNRTDEEQDAIYRNDPNYQRRPWKSVHQVIPCRGADIRTSDMPDRLAWKITQMIQQITYDRERPEKESVKYGGERHQSHIHLQVWDG